MEYGEGMPTTTPGLRERKRAETRARIEDAALSLVLRDGLDAATIDAISERADISPRTFFNYFDSKESAILGVHPIEVTDELADRHLADHLADPPAGALVPAVVGLLFAVMGSPMSTRPTQHSDRLEAIRRHPEVLRGQMDQLKARAGRLTESIEQLLAASPAAPTSTVDLRAQAELLLSVCGTAVRVAVREWSEGTSDDTTHIEARAIALVDQIRGTLA